MNSANRLFVGVFLLACTFEISGQYVPPPPPEPFSGFINEALRAGDPTAYKWDLGGSVRARLEVKEQFGIAGVPGSVDFRSRGADTSDEYFLEKIRVHAGYAGNWWGAYVEGRSSLAQNDERFSATAPVPRKGDGPESDRIDLHQGYLTLGNPKEFPLTVKLGRQELSYGEERIIGAFAWNNIGRVFDAAKARWHNSWFDVDLFASQVVIPEDDRFNVSNGHDWFSGFYATTPKIPKHTLDLYFLSRNASDQAATYEPSPQFPQPSARDIYSLGLRLKSIPAQLGAWDYTADLIGQLGHFNDTRPGVRYQSQDQQAYAVILQGGYTFRNAFGTPRLGLEYAHGSGDSNPNDKKHETFENLFPTNHKFYGYMDFVSLQNIHDFRFIYQMRPFSRLSLAVEGHLFWLANTSDNFYTVSGVPRGGGGPSASGYGVNPSYGSFVGSELDLIAGYALNKFTQLEAGYGHFFVGDYIAASLQPVGGAADANYFYLQCSLSF
jgi:hypothetical protein